jgi:hypothetical protein
MCTDIDEQDEQDGFLNLLTFNRANLISIVPSRCLQALLRYELNSMDEPEKYVFK